MLWTNSSFTSKFCCLFFLAFSTFLGTKASTKFAGRKKGILDLHKETVNDKVIPKKLKGLVILIDFSDAPANVLLTRADSLINGLNYTEPTVTASVRKYWLNQSRGKVDLQHDIFGYFRAPQTAAWYKKQNWTVFLDLSKQALEWFKKENPKYDWNSLSVSSDAGEEGTFLSMNFFTTDWIAGSGGTHRINDWTAPNGGKLGQITAQNFIAPSDKNINLFWFNHELGHSAWGVPDTYDHDGSSAGTGAYSVMSGNRSNGQVEAFGAPFLIKMGWVKAIDIKGNQSYTLTEDGDVIARFTNPSNPKEYFLIEARNKSTLGNEMIPTDRGLLIWHVDENVKTTNDNESMTALAHYAHAIVQADGQFDLEHGKNKTDGGDYFVEGKGFSDSSNPSSKWWDGTSSNININSIKFLPNNKISFCNGTCP
ncbi:M6 family metalloprotease-like protein [Pedobacter sp. UYEF25]